MQRVSTFYLHSDFLRPEQNSPSNTYALRQSALFEKLPSGYLCESLMQKSSSAAVPF